MNDRTAQAELARRIDTHHDPQDLAAALGLLTLDGPADRTERAILREPLADAAAPCILQPQAPDRDLQTLADIDTVDRLLNPIDERALAPAQVPALASETPACAAPDDSAIDLAARVSQLEAQQAEAIAAIDTLVTALIDVRDRPVPADPDTTRCITELVQRVQAAEQSAARERALVDLAAVSRGHLKQPRMVFVGTTYFGCNVKYAWLAAREAAEAAGVEVWFLPFDARQEAQVRTLTPQCFPHAWDRWTDADVQCALGAAVVVTTDHFLNPNPYAPALLAGARHVQLWHGISIKEIGLRNIVGLKHMTPRMARLMATCGPYASLVGTARAHFDEWQRWFSFEQYAALGYARNDVLHREPNAADLTNVDTDLLERMRAVRRAGHRVIFYAPTFRDGKGIVWLLEAGMEQVAADVARRGDLLVLNVHPVEAPQVPSIAPALPSVAFVTPRSDVYPLLRESDLLVTDYSSLMFDYLHLDRPIVLYRPDHARYTSQSRQLFDAKLATLPGPCVTQVDELISALRRRGADSHGAARQTLRDQLFDAVDGASAARLWPHLLAQMQTAITAHQPVCCPA